MPDIVTPLAQAAAQAIERRAFLRRAAHGVFVSAAVLAAGGGVDAIFATNAWAYSSVCEGVRGLGCPGATSGNPCGPSRCCNYLQNGALPSGCDCSNSSGGCKSGTTHCGGNDPSAWGSDPVTGRGCWTCNKQSQKPPPCYKCGTTTCVDITTCCDCKTSGCAYNGCVNTGAPNCNRCISWTQTRVSC